MRYAILSDVHGHREELAAVLADARQRNARRFLSLGDVGDNGCVEILRQARALAVFGNYEVSGWRRLPPESQRWVLGWPPVLARDDFLAAHAAPWWPQELDRARPGGQPTLRDFGAWLRKTGKPWRSAFPYLTEDEEYRWQALAELETAGKRVLFFGHTHRQTLWQWQPSGRMQQVHATEVEIQPAHRYLVGVGSVGLPEDGRKAAYTMYDTTTGHIEQIRLDTSQDRPDA